MAEVQVMQPVGHTTHEEPDKYKPDVQLQIEPDKIKKPDVLQAVQVVEFVQVVQPTIAVLQARQAPAAEEAYKPAPHLQTPLAIVKVAIHEVHKVAEVQARQYCGHTTQEVPLM